MSVRSKLAESIIILCNQGKRGQIAEGWNWGNVPKDDNRDSLAYYSLSNYSGARTIPKMAFKAQTERRRRRIIENPGHSIARPTSLRMKATRKGLLILEIDLGQN